MTSMNTAVFQHQQIHVYYRYYSFYFVYHNHNFMENTGTSRDPVNPDTLFEVEL